MKIFRLRMVWERLAREDPYWAVLTSPDKVGNRWQIEEFFRTGRDDVDAALAFVAEHQVDLPRGAALDFGCGVGRLSQALALHFDHVTGVDVAAGMIELARRHAPADARISFVHNPASTLHRFADASFDLVFSQITLQHVSAELIPGYLREFVRICRPGGVISFQLPTYVPPAEVEVKRYSFYPPTMWKRIRRWTTRWFRRTTGIGYVMSMASLPEAEVRRILQEAGAELVATRDHPMDVGYRSLFYLARPRAPGITPNTRA